MPVQWSAAACSFNLGCFCWHRVCCCSFPAHGSGMLSCVPTESSNLPQWNNSRTGVWKRLFPSERQGICAIMSASSEYLLSLSKALQHVNSHQPGTVQASCSMVIRLSTQERAQGLLSKGVVLRNKHKKQQFIKMKQNLAFSSKTSIKRTELGSKGAE